MADNMNVTVRDPLAPRRQMPPIVIGRAGEYGVTTVTFDLRGLIDRYGAGVPTLLHKRPPDDEAYIVPPSAADTETHDRTEMPDSETLVWHVGQVATSYVGNGKIELQWHPDGAEKKSAQFDVVVLGTIGKPVSEFPDAQQIYLDVMQGIADDAEDAADRAEAAVSHYPRIQNGTWWVWDAANSEWVNTGVSAQGPVGDTGANGRDGQDGAPGAPGTPGADGVSPTVQTSTITGGHRVTITDAEHPSGQTFDVMDGEDGGSGNFVLLHADDERRVFNGTTPITGAQIYALAETVKAVFLWDEDGEYLYAFDTVRNGDVYFLMPSFDGNGFYAAVVNGNNNECSFSARPAVPRVSGSDAGKVMTVNSSGEWAAQAPAGSPNAVLYTQQSLTAAQQEQARGNIGAPSASVLATILIPILRDGLYGTDQTAAISALEIALGGAPEPEDPIETYTPTLTDGFITPNGSVNSSTSYKYTQKIPVRQGDKVYGTCYDSSASTTVNKISARFTCVYGESGNVIESAGSNTELNLTESSPYIVPADVYGVVFSTPNRFANDVVVYVDKSERAVS